MIDCIDRIDRMKERYAEARQYLRWFEPAWKYLSEEDRQILTESFCERMPWQEICKKHYFSKSVLYRRRYQALDRLATLLYGHGAENDA